MVVISYVLQSIRHVGILFSLPRPPGREGGKSEARDTRECMHIVQAMKKKKRCVFVSSAGKN